MNRQLDQIAWDWGVRCFGAAHMANIPLRALRMIEEAVEAGQALGLNRAQLHLLVEEVYKRPSGDVEQEVGGGFVTMRMLCCALGADPEHLYLKENPPMSR